MKTLNQLIEEEIDKFNQKFAYKFNIGVIPDNFTRKDIIEFIRQSLTNIAKATVDECENKINIIIGHDLDYKEDWHDNCMTCDIISDIKSLIDYKPSKPKKIK